MKMTAHKLLEKHRKIFDSNLSLGDRYAIVPEPVALAAIDEAVQMVANNRVLVSGQSLNIKCNKDGSIKETTTDQVTMMDRNEAIEKMVAQEREACAKISDLFLDNKINMAGEIGRAIRARGNGDGQ